jgi:hypothetical protein
MDERLVEEIRKNFEEKSNEELLKILNDDDRDQWSDEAFEAIRRILKERPESPRPTLGSPHVMKEGHVDEREPTTSQQLPVNYKWFRIGIIFAAFFYVFYLAKQGWREEVALVVTIISVVYWMVLTGLTKLSKAAVMTVLLAVLSILANVLALNLPPSVRTDPKTVAFTRVLAYVSLTLMSTVQLMIFGLIFYGLNRLFRRKSQL